VSKWSEKYVIGLTGNIATGKSVVRKMLEHLGAYGIDADALAHRAIAKGAPGYRPVIETFGKWVVAQDGEIDRSRLARVVFADPQALTQLESIIHPLVEQAIGILVQRAPQRVIVIEAIKLLEANLNKSCDSIWVTYAPPEIQMTRLIQGRKMSESEARQRIAAQPSQEAKLAAANIVIRNTSSFTETWKLVNTAWQRSVPAEVEAIPVTPMPSKVRPEGEMTVLRGRPRHSTEIAELLNRILKPRPLLNQENVMAAFGEKAFFLLQVGSRSFGLVGWQVENLVSRATDVVLDPQISPAQALPALLNEMERASKDLQCEAALVFVKPDLVNVDNIWSNLGYEQLEPDRLEVRAWQEAARESMPADTIMFFKKLRQDRILRPI